MTWGPDYWLIICWTKVSRIKKTMRRSEFHFRHAEFKEQWKVQEAARWDGACGRKNIPTHSPKYFYVLIPGAWGYITFHGKRDWADVIKLRISRRGDYPGGFNVIKRVLWREKQVLGMEGGRGVGQLGREVWGWKQRSEWLALSKTASINWSQGTDSLLQSPERMQLCQHLDFNLLKPILDFWLPEW